MISQSWLPAKIQKEYKLNISTKKIRFNFLNAFILDGVSMPDPIQVSIEKAVISLKPWRRLTSPDKSWITIEIHDGEVRSHWKGQKFFIQRVSGVVYISLKSVQADLRGREVEWGDIELNFQKTPNKNQHDWTSLVTIPKFDVNLLQKIVGERALKWGAIQGAATAKISLKGQWPFTEDSLVWTADIETRDARWTPPAAQHAPFPILSHIEITPKLIHIHSFSVSKFLAMTGIIRNFTKNPELNLTMEGNNFPLSAMRSFFPRMKIWPLLKGKNHFLLKADGTIKDPIINGTFAWDPELEKFRLPKIIGDLAYSSHRFQVKGSFSNGNYSAVLGSAKEKEFRSQVTLENISLGALASINGLKNVNGQLDSSLQLLISDSFPTVTGSFSLKEFKWGDNFYQHEAKGQVNVSADEIAIQTENNSLTFHGRSTSEEFVLENFAFDLGNQSYLSAAGKYRYADGLMKFALVGKNIPPDVWPPLRARYPAISASMALEGEIYGTLMNPQVDARLVFDQLKFYPDRSSLSGVAEFLWNKERTALRNIQIKGGYVGQLLRTNVGGQTVSQVSLGLNNASPVLLADVMKSTAVVGGSLNGTVQIEYNGEYSIGQSSLTWQNGQIENFNFDELSFDARFEEKKIHIVDLTILRGPQSLSFDGLLEPAGRRWLYDLSMQFQRWSFKSATLDGGVRSAGSINLKDLSINGSFRSPVFWVNDYSLENIDTQFKKSKDWMEAFGQATPDLHFHLNYKPSREKINARVSGENLSIEDVLGKLAKLPQQDKLPKGLFSFNVNLSGTLTEPKGKIHVNVSEGQWRSETFKSQLVFDLSRSTLTLVGGKATLEKGGDFFLSGLIPLNPNSSESAAPAPFLLEGAGSNLNLRSVFQLLNWPVAWDGVTNVKLSVIGKPDGPQIKVYFDGSHNGYGPFSQGGAFSGNVASEKGELTLSDVRIASGNGFVRLLSGSKVFLEKNNAARMLLALDVRNLQAGVLTFFGGVEITGVWNGTLGGGRESNSTDLEIFARSLWINQFVLEGNVTHLTLRPGEVQFSPILGSGQEISGVLRYDQFPELKVENFKFLENGIERIILDGFVGSQHWDFKLDANGIDASVIRGMFDTTFPISGPMNLRLIGKGSLREPSFKSHIEWRDGKFWSVPVDQASCDFTLEKNQVTLQNLKAFRRRGYELSGRIAFDLVAYGEENPRQIDVDVHLQKGDLSILESIWPECQKARGNFNARLKMNSRKGQSSISGYASAQKVFLRSDYTPKLHKGEIKLKLINDKLIIDEAHAILGRGRINLKGGIAFLNGRPNVYNLMLESEGRHGISVRVPQLAIPPGPVLGRFEIFTKKLSGVSRGEPRVRIHLTGPASAPTIQGTIDLENTVFSYPPSKSKDQKGASLFGRWWSSFRERMNWNLTLNAGDRTWYQNELVDANVTGSLQILGAPGDYIVDGHIKTEQGAIVYSGSEFKIKNATLDIETDYARLNPGQSNQTLIYLGARAEKEVYYTDGLGNNNQDIIVMQVDRALLGEIEPRFFAKGNPNLASQRALQLALGLPLSEPVETNAFLPDQRSDKSKEKEDTDKLLRLGLVQLLDASLASPLARAIARNTGLVDFIRVTYQDQDSLSDSTAIASAESQETPPNITQNQFLRYAKGTKVKFGKGITNRLFADYSFRVDEFQNQIDLRHEVELAYRLHRNLFLRGVSELDTQRALGRSPDRRALLENQWRFGLPRKKKSPPKESKMPTNSPSQQLTKR